MLERARRFVVTDYWFDDSARVPCTEPHTTETAQVLELSAPTIAEAKQEAATCVGTTSSTT